MCLFQGHDSPPSCTSTEYGIISYDCVSCQNSSLLLDYIFDGFPMSKEAKMFANRQVI